MSKNQNKFFTTLFFISAVFVASLFTYLYFLYDIKAMNRQKHELEELLTEKINRLEMKLVEVQRLSAEDRIVSIAKEELGLIRAVQPFEKLIIDKNQIEQIKKIVDSRYEQ